MTKKFFIIILLLIFSTIPAFSRMQTTMDRLMNSWTGENIDSVIDLWGSPTETKTTDIGKTYYWIKKQDIIMPGTGVYGGMYGGTSICNKNFEVDKNDIIINWNWNGNACPSTYREVKKYLNPENNYWNNKQKNRK